MNFKFLIILTIIITNSFVASSQNITVEKVKLIETVDNKYVSEIPRLKDLANEKNLIVDKINTYILDWFMISSFNQNDLDEFRWYDVKCSSEIKEQILYISFKGEYYGAYLNTVEEELLFDLTNGELLELNNIPFQALFTLNGYFEFLNKYWLEGVRKEFKEAINCTELKDEPACSYYDIEEYKLANGKLSLSLRDDCYPYVQRACNPYYRISVDVDSVHKYLNELGKYLLVDSKYMTLSSLGRFIENKRLKKLIENNVFIFGKINDQYPFSMAINIDPDGLVDGYYYYDKKMEHIDLVGQYKSDEIKLKEYFNNKQTGQFEFHIQDELHSKGFFLFRPDEDAMYVIGKWVNPHKDKSYDINITEIKLCRSLPE